MSAARFRLIVSTIHTASVAFLVLLLVASSSVAQTIEGKFYEYKTMSTTGQTPANANQPLTGMSGPSINQNGVVAFSATFNGNGEGIVAASPTLPQTVVSFADPASGRLFGSSVQINTADQVLASDFLSSSYFDRLWYVKKPGAFTTLVRGGPGQTYSSVLSNGGINSKGDAVVPALDPSGNDLILSIHGGTIDQLSLPANSFPFPRITDAGNILVRFGHQPNSPVYLYDQTLTQQLLPVTPSTCFSVIGNQPGISPDGLVITFYGAPIGSCAASMGPTPGIFAAVNIGTGWQYVRVTGIPAELGYDDNGNALSFSSYSNDSRVAVVNLGLAPVPPCAAGPAIAGNSFVVSFIGTPSGSSRTNPILGTGHPLLFSNQQGLWTIRVDADCQLSSPGTLVFHPRTAIPVVQIGDQMAGNIISSINVFDQLANAAEDDNGVIRTMRRGDHRVVFWAQTSTGQQMIVRGSHLDSDQDGLLDHWETAGIDMDQDGIVDLNLSAMGANPTKRDYFVQIDWLGDLTASSRFQPLPGVINAAPGQLVSPLEFMFLNAPSLTGNMYGVRSDGQAPAPIPIGITLHIDGGPGKDKAQQSFSLNMNNGPLAGGNQVIQNGAVVDVLYFGLPNSITVPNLNTLAFQTAKDAFLGQLDKDGRELAFHYIVFADYFGFYSASGLNTWTVASATANTLTSSSALPAAAASGDVIKITAGTASGQYRYITAVTPATNTLTVTPNWQPQPDSTSSFMILKGNSGVAEVFFNNDPDANSLPGNDLMITVGPMGAAGFVTNGVLGTPCFHWRTLAHELGHNLGLRHGGTDQNTMKGNNYLSLMSYSWTLACNSAVQSFSGATDPTFDDWANLQPDFPNVAIHLGNSLGLAFGALPESTEQVPEPTPADYTNKNGPPNSVPPVIKILKPAANGNVGLTLPLQVTVNTTDSTPISSVTVAFDVNGDGNTNGTGENVRAKLTGANTYAANFAALSGPTGPRTIAVSAIDTTGNYATVSETVHVQAPNPVPALNSLAPASATHGGPGFTLTVNGSNFVSGAYAQWNGANRATTFVNSGQVTVKILAGDIATAGTANITVKNLAPGGGTSNTLTFTIN
jgi:hypothetical protein